MKLMRYGAKGSERPGLIDAQGKVRALSGVVADLGPEELSRASLAKLRTIDPVTLPLVAQPGRIAPPWSWCGKFLCIDQPGPFRALGNVAHQLHRDLSLLSTSNQLDMPPSAIITLPVVNAASSLAR
jgi:hypothetical protein